MSSTMLSLLQLQWLKRKFQFKVCKSVHHHSIQINQTTRCNNFSSLLLDIYVQLNMFRASSRPSLSVNRPDRDQQHCYHHAPTVKPEAATTVVELLMMDARKPETCWAVHTSKRQVINLRNCCIWLVDLFEKFVNILLEQIYWHSTGKKKSGVVDVGEDIITKNGRPSQSFTCRYSFSLARNSSPLNENKIPLPFVRPYRQQPPCPINIICPYATHFFYDLQKIILPSKPGLYKWSL